MVEQSIYFALGCIVTALLAMMFGPVYWRRALRLTRKRLQLQVPLSMQEILAERDQLRAAFAVERVRLEQQLEAVQATKAADMAELGRRAMEVTALREEMAALVSKGSESAADLARLTRDVAEAGAEIGALRGALDDASARLETWRTRAYAKAEEADRLRDEVESQRTTIAGLKTRAMGLEMRLSDAQRTETDRARTAEEALRSRLEAAMSQATRHETSAIALRRERDDARARVRALEDQIAAAPATLADGSGSLTADGSDEDLRASIHALGLAVAMMSRRQAQEREDPVPPAALVPEAEASPASAH